MSATPPPKRKPTWVEGPPGRHTNKKGYTLTRIANTKGWRLCEPDGSFLITQLELFSGMPVVFEWAEQYIAYLEAQAKKRSKTKSP